MELIDKFDEWATRHWKLVVSICIAFIIVFAAITGGIE